MASFGPQRLAGIEFFAGRLWTIAARAASKNRLSGESVQLKACAAQARTPS